MALPNRIALTFFCLFACQPLLLHAEALPIIVDGQFDDWGAATPVVDDALESTGQDLGTIYVANDDDFLYFRVDVTRETILQNDPSSEAGNELKLFLDADGSAETGFQTRGIGADLIAYFGYRGIYYYQTPTSPVWSSQNDFGVRSAPTHSASQFEIAFERDRMPLQGSDSVSFYFAIGSSDYAPDTGTVSYSFATGAPDAEPITIDRIDATDVRILSWNVHSDSPDSNPAPFTRILQATQPDIVNFQEVYRWSAATTRDFVADALEGNWYAAEVSDCITVSRWPIAASVASDGNLVSLIDLPPGISNRDLVVINAHTPCCEDNSGRDREHDRMSQVWRNAMENTGPFTTSGDEAVVMVGDFNMVGYVRQLETLRDGTFINEATYGPNFSPARERGSLTSAPLRHTHTREAFTWQNPNGSFAPGKLDFILVGEDAATLKKSYCLYTRDIPNDVLTEYGLYSSDSVASDHVPAIADLEFVPEPAPSGLLTY